jgi:hypothetical protein
VVTTDEHQVVDDHAADAPPARRRRRRRRAPSAPVARFEPGRLGDVKQRNPGWLLAGVLLVLLSALGGVLLFASRGDRMDALVAARDLAAGEQLAASDLRLERVAIDGAVGTVDESMLAELVGRHAVGPVPAGALVHPDMFSAAAPLAADEMEIGAALDPGEFPLSNLPSGTSVELLVARAAEPSAAAAASAAATADPRAAPPAETTSVGTGVVTMVEERATGQLLVTLRVARDVGLVAAQANRDDTLRLAVIGGQS